MRKGGVEAGESTDVVNRDKFDNNLSQYIVTSLSFVSEADFKKPEPVRWYKIYGMIFESLTEEKPENGEEKASLLFPKYCKSENPEFYEESGAIIWFTLVMQQLFFSCGINDFTFKDIRDPRPKRCTILCSAVVNFIRFKVNREPVIESALEKAERYKIQYGEITKTNNELKSRISAEMAQYDERESKIQQLQEKINTTNDKMVAIQSESQNLLAKISEKKMIISEARARRDELKLEIMKVTQECEKLQRNIVQSPQKVKANLCSMQEKVEFLKKIKTEKLELVSSRRKQLDQLKTRNSIVEQGISFMQSMLEDSESIKTIEEDIKRIKESSQVNVHKRKGIKIQEEEMVESIALIQDRIQKLQLQKRSRGTDLDACFSQTTEKKKKTAIKADALKTQKETLQREIDAKMKKVETNHNKCTEKIEMIKEQYENILKSLNQYHLVLQERIQADLYDCGFFLKKQRTFCTLSLDPDMNPDEEEEKHRLISQVLELQNTLDDLSSRVDSVKEENLKLKSENQVLGQYIENLMAASSVFQSTSPAKAKKKSGAGGNSVTELMAGDK
ncbi:SCOC [Acanthosepion pharaonis]|uniref:SCOC n=1 Tax=Acanthosepion pharaonis TaxID=158019 RepID=A0A812DGC0_ACAPH|nr:SCOC [Sepia pharaonis]